MSGAGRSSRRSSLTPTAISTPRARPSAPDSTAAPLANTGNTPARIVIDSAGRLYTADFNSNTITVISPGGGTPDTAPAPPDIPRTPTAVPGVASATVTVPANPASSRYGAPTSYTVTAAADPSRACTVTVPATSCTVTGLAPSTAYTFTAQANLNAGRTAASGPSAPITPVAAPSPVTPVTPVTPITPPQPKRLAGVLRMKKGVGTTTGRVPAGATRIVQTARTGGSTATEGFAEMAWATARAKRATGKCRITAMRNTRTKKVVRRNYRCTIKLTKGTWTVTTTARGKAAMVAKGVRKVRVR